EVILGATTDPAMTSRAQAILIFTGVGGRPMQTQARANALEIEQTEQTESVTAGEEDLDLPTFLRRRVEMGQGR
ncbi:MAG: hypothetical protein PVH92_09430, partial [Anaerolineales bacterium]